MQSSGTAGQKPASEFSNFSIHPRLIDNLTTLGFVAPTPIQSEVIPLVLDGKDVFGQASTGTGKTGAFLIPLINRLASDRNARALILAPTRELVQQIVNVAVSMSQDSSVKTLSIVGGESMFKQIQTLKRSPQLLIATPGRLLDHLGSGKLKLQGLSYLVLDEVDRMLDMGFAPQLEEISKFLPNNRQTLFFSATMTPTIREMMRRYTKTAVDVICKPKAEEPLKIEERDVVSHPREKNTVLLKLVKETVGKMIIFTSTQVRTELLADLLERDGHDVTMIHGGRSQKLRRSALSDFKSGKVRIMVATDVASRGIDVFDIEYVVNYDLPQCKDDYTHRIGRTGRFGRSGVALNFVSPGRTGGERWSSEGYGGRPRKGGRQNFTVRPARPFDRERSGGERNGRGRMAERTIRDWKSSDRRRSGDREEAPASFRRENGEPRGDRSTFLSKNPDGGNERDYSRKRRTSGGFRRDQRN